MSNQTETKFVDSSGDETISNDSTNHKDLDLHQRSATKNFSRYKNKDLRNGHMTLNNQLNKARKPETTNDVIQGPFKWKKGRQGQKHNSKTRLVTDKQKDNKGKRDNSQKVIRPWLTCFYLSSAFFFVYTAFEAIQNLQSSLNNEDNLGMTSLAVMYMFSVAGALTGPFMARVFSARRLIRLAFVGHFCYILCNFYPSFALLIPMSAYMGLSLAYLGMSLGLYLTEASKDYITINKLPVTKLHSVLSMFNGVFYSCFKGTHVSGNLISSLVLFSSSYNATELEDNACGAQICSSSYNKTVIVEPDEHVVQILLTVFAVCVIMGFGISYGLPKLSMDREDSETSKKETVTRTMSGCIRKVTSVRFMILIPLFMAQSMIIMIMYTAYTEAFVTCSIGIQWVGYSMVSLGALSALSSLVVNFLARFTNRVTVFVIGISIDLASVIAMLIWVPDHTTHKYLLFLLPAVAGVSEGIMQPQFSALIADVFSDELPEAYSAFSGTKCMSFSLSLFISSFGCVYHRLYLSLGLYHFGIIGYIITEVREYRRKKSTKTGTGTTIDIAEKCEALADEIIRSCDLLNEKHEEESSGGDTDEERHDWLESDEEDGEEDDDKQSLLGNRDNGGQKFSSRQSR